MEEFAEKALRYYGEVCVHKELVRQAGLGNRSIPAFVSEWIVARYATEQTLTDEARQQIQDFITRHLPPKDQREQLKEQLRRGEALLLLDQYSASVDLARGELHLRIPLLDENKATIAEHLVERYPLLLGSGVWGVGKLSYIPGMSGKGGGMVEMTDFRPMQAATIDVDLFCEQRRHFTLAEWRDLLVSSVGYNPAAYSPAEQLLLLTRLLPLVQERVNLMELAPKGTGKSYIYLNLSRYVRVVSGGKVTAAVLFYNNSSNQPGLLTQFDAVVFDEGQTLSFDNPSEVIGVLKDYLESGQFARGGKQKVEATAGLVILANIPLDAEGKPRQRNYFLNLPDFLGETAFIDRIHGILPGWELPRIRESAISRTIGFKADFLGEILHALRHRAGYEALVELRSHIEGTDDRRDRTAILRLATGYMKLLFPHQEVSQSDFEAYCLHPAIRLRQLVRDQLALLDPEFRPIRITVGGGRP